MISISTHAHQARPQHLAILGATGSIGDSTLDLLRLHPTKYRAYALSGYGQVDKLFDLCVEFQPVFVCTSVANHEQLANRLAAVNLKTQVLSGDAGLIQIASDAQVDTVVAAIVGAAGLLSTIAAVRAGKRILLANKESLVMAGELVMKLAKKSGATILPIDSEHNAIYQCLPAAVQTDNSAVHDDSHGIRQLWLTASGGGFLYKSVDEMAKASVQDAVNHPNWSMGQKISIDSATMMNKGLELIEACHLFNLPESRISVVIHPNSVIHSLVEYTDGSFLAQLGSPDMKTPIAHALAYPERIDAGVNRLDLYQLADLKFIKPDTDKFICLKLARQAAKTGTGACITLNAANEVAVAAFLAEKIRLTDIADIVADCLRDARIISEFNQDFTDEDAGLSRIMQLDKLVREAAHDKLAKLGKGVY